MTHEPPTIRKSTTIWEQKIEEKLKEKRRINIEHSKRKNTENKKVQIRNFGREKRDQRERGRM